MDDNFNFQDDKCYVLVGVAVIQGEIEKSAIYVRFGKDAKEGDEEAVVSYANTIHEQFRVT